MRTIFPPVEAARAAAVIAEAEEMEAVEVVILAVLGSSAAVFVPWD